MNEQEMPEMEIEIKTAEQDDESMYQNMAPKGNFSSKALNILVGATNKLLPLFGQSPDYPQFQEGAKVLPTDFVRVLAMFQGATNQAVDADDVPAELDFMMEDLTDDRALVMLAGKLSKLATSKDFKQFLKNPPMEEPMEEEAPAEEEPVAPSMEETDKLFMGRM